MSKHRAVPSLVLTIPLACALAGCGGAGGDDGDAVLSTSTSDGSSGGASGTSGASSEGTSGADASTTAAGSTTAAACEPDFDLALLDAHVVDLVSLFGDLSGSVGEDVSAAMVAAPGYPAESALGLAIAAKCAAPGSLDPVCEGGWCRQLSCTGVGAGWSIASWLEATPVNVGALTFQALSTSIDWASADAPVQVTISSTATAGSADWSVSAAGSLTAGGWSMNELLPALVDGRSVVLSVSGGASGVSGEVTVDGVTVATLVGDPATLTPTGACP